MLGQICSKKINRDNFARISYIIINESDVCTSFTYAIQLRKQKGQFCEIPLHHFKDSLIVYFSIFITVLQGVIYFLKCRIFIDDIHCSLITFLLSYLFVIIL